MKTRLQLRRAMLKSRVERARKMVHYSTIQYHQVAQGNAPDGEVALRVPDSASTQEEIDAKALAIAKRLFQKHAKTWEELAKY